MGADKQASHTTIPFLVAGVGVAIAVALLIQFTRIHLVLSNTWDGFYIQSWMSIAVYGGVFGALVGAGVGALSRIVGFERWGQLAVGLASESALLLAVLSGMALLIGRHEVSFKIGYLALLVGVVAVVRGRSVLMDSSGGRLAAMHRRSVLLGGAAAAFVAWGFVPSMGEAIYWELDDDVALAVLGATAAGISMGLLAMVAWAAHGRWYRSWSYMYGVPAFMVALVPWLVAVIIWEEECLSWFVPLCIVVNLVVVAALWVRVTKEVGDPTAFVLVRNGREYPLALSHASRLAAQRIIEPSDDVRTESGETLSASDIDELEPFWAIPKVHYYLYGIGIGGFVLLDAVLWLFPDASWSVQTIQLGCVYLRWFVLGIGVGIPMVETIVQRTQLQRRYRAERLPV